MTDEKIEYRAGQIWMDTIGYPVIRHITNTRGTHDAWFINPVDEGDGEVVHNISNTQLEFYAATLLHNPTVKWKVGDVVPVGTQTIDRTWVGDFGPDDGVPQKPYVFDPHEGNLYEATIIWIETKENTDA